MASLAGATRVHRADTPNTEGSFPGAQSFHEVGSVHRATAEGSTVRLTPPSTSSLGKRGRPVLSAGSLVWGSHLKQEGLWKPRPASLCPHPIISRLAASHTWCGGRGRKLCVWPVRAPNDMEDSTNAANKTRYKNNVCACVSAKN